MSFSAQNFLKILHILFFYQLKSFFGVFFLRNIFFESMQNVFSIFCFHCLTVTNRRKTSTATDKYLTPLFCFVSLSTKAKSIHQISLIRFEKNLKSLETSDWWTKFCLQCLGFCKKCSYFFSKNPLASLKFHIEPDAALPLEYNLFRLTF